MIRDALIRWVVLTLAVLAAAAIIPGIHYASFSGLFIAALVLGILNTFVKPLLTILSFPFIIITVGIFILVINALLLMLTGWLVSDFYVSSFWSALGGGFIISLVGLLFKDKKKKHRIRVQTTGSPTRHSHTSSKPPPGKGPIIDV